MLVDDDQAMLAVMSEVLSIITEAEVVSFSSPIAAIQAFRQDPAGFDLVISDFDMPELDGVEMCHVLRAMAPELKTILATGNMGITFEDAQEQGFDALLHKPFSVASLQATIGKVQKQAHRTSVPLLQAA